ncbi:MAG TPA: response regulator [Chthoniobacteraceae bacterium]|jgi:DNA-binding response OmpR family regulator|nr:response regulator [Chthoniobacteraceae bacterium]
MKNARLLVVEDEAITAIALRRELTTLGYRVIETAGNVDDAFQKAKRERPDLVLMDITLSGEVDGIAAAAAMRGDLGLPVVFLTAHQDERTMERALLAGPYGYVLKPFTGIELKAVIEVALQRHAAEAQRTELARAAGA